MEKIKKVKPINIQGIKFTVDMTPENSTPEKIEQRLRNLVKISIDILSRQKRLRSGLTLERMREAWGKQNHEKKIGADQGFDDKAEDLEMSETIEKEIRIRLSVYEWRQIEQEARRLRMSSTQLSRKWVLEGLNRWYPSCFRR